MATVVGTGAAITLANPNSSRGGLAIFNDSGVTVFVKFGSAASAGDYTVKLVDQSFYEMPTPSYTGLLTGFWASGSIQVTEITTSGDEVLP